MSNPSTPPLSNASAPCQELDLDALLDDRAEEGIFRVSREAFTDETVFAAEVAHIFESTWLFLGLESQIPNPHDFLTTYMGRHPVLLTRDSKGDIGCFLNTCRHKGAVVCPYKQGNARTHMCRYHGWAYSSGGKNINIAHAIDGQYAPTFNEQNHDLTPIARLASYRGLIFGSLSDDVPSLEEHLGDVRRFLDLVIDQGPKGLEVLPGTVAYTFDANWKLQFENGLDFYHFATTHSAYVDVMGQRVKAGELELGSYETPETEEAAGSYSFDRGHAVMYSIRQNGPMYKRLIAHEATSIEEIRARVGQTRAKWMLRHRNLTIYPNLQIIDITSLQFRTWRPLAPNKTEITSRCVAPIGESDATRAQRVRNYEDFFNPTGLGSSDDNIMYEYVQTGLEAAAAGKTQGYERGLGTPARVDDPFSRELQIEPRAWAYGPVSFGDETCIHAGYREWRRLLERGQARTRSVQQGGSK